MVTRFHLLIWALLISFGTSTTMAQTSAAEFQKLLQQKASFEETDFAALQLQQPVVRVAPVSDKREVAVSGLVNIHASADDFLQSYRGGMSQKNNSAILEIGSFAKEPALSDLQNLTIDTQDIEELKQCVVGDCQVKLSAAMIERFRKEIDWQAPDYQSNATNLFKKILLEYVSDYRSRGEAALIEYNDKRNEVSLTAEHRALTSAPSYIKDYFADKRSDLQLLEDTIVWSKIKFGLKPVIAINHITIYRRNTDVGPEALVASKQIYANHYFTAFLALTAYVNVPDSGAYLVYENRCRADGLEGPLSKIKRGVVEKKALEGLKDILAQSKASLDGPGLSATAAEFASHRSYGWRQRLFGGIRPLLWVVMLSALVAFLALGKRRGDSPTSKALKPESAKS